MASNRHAAAKQGDHVHTLKEVELKKNFSGCGDEESQEEIAKEDEHISTHNQEIEKKNQNEERNLLLVVAAVIATVTYQAALSPPSSIWKEGVNLDYKCLHETFYRSHSFRQPSLLRDCPALKYFLFMLINTFTLSTSVASIFYLLTAKAPILTGKAMIGASIIWLLVTYAYLIISMTADGESASLLCIPIYVALLFIAYLWIKYGITITWVSKRRKRSIEKGKEMEGEH